MGHRHRQRGGLTVLGVAVVLVAVITGLRPHLVAGAAQAAPVPGPPAVGDCVLDLLPGPPLGIIPTVTATSGGTVPIYPAQQIQPCTAARYGEIAAVMATPRPTIVRGDNADGLYLDDPNQDSCISSAMQYVGMTTQLRYWRPALQIYIALSKPSTRQDAAGQHWVACIVHLPPPNSESAPTVQSLAAPQYGNSIRNAVHTGRQRDELSTCLPTADWNDNSTPGGCRQPHALEVLALGDSGDHPMPRSELELSCQQLDRQFTAMADPTAAGTLAIQINITDNNGAPITTARIPPHSNLACGVATAGSRKLGGSLLALGRHPIPWA